MEYKLQDGSAAAMPEIPRRHGVAIKFIFISRSTDSTFETFCAINTTVTKKGTNYNILEVCIQFYVMSVAITSQNFLFFFQMYTILIIF